MPHYKLAYFNSKGRAEVIRILFHLGDIKYEDFRMADQQEWAKYKQEMPCKQVPVLFVDGEPLTQCKAIARYVARETGFYGTNNLECARIDAVMDVCEDWHRAMLGWFQTQDPKEKESKVKVLREKEVPQVCTNLETLLQQNKSENGFFVSEKMTVADLFVFSEIELVSVFVENLLDKYPKLSALYARVAANDKVAEWIAKRPKTEF